MAAIELTLVDMDDLVTSGEGRHSYCSGQGTEAVMEVDGQSSEVWHVTCATESRRGGSCGDCGGDCGR